MKKKWLGYVGFILFMSCFIFVSKASVDGAQEYMNNTFRMPIIWVIVNSIAPYIGFGFLLGLNPFFKEKAKEGKWRINLIKLIVIGGPSLMFSYGFHLIYFLNIPLGRFGSFLVTKPSTYMILFRVLLGYVVATSFYKESDTEGI